MSHTQWYFNQVQRHRAGLKALHEKYDAELNKIEQYSGSEGYEQEKAEIEKNRRAELTTFQQKCLKDFMVTIGEMRKSAKNKEMIAPTSDELALLQALKMRETISKDELEQAARTLKNCPVGLSILNEIAEKNELRGVHFGAEDTASVLAHIDSLEDSAKRIAALERCDSRQEMAARASIYHPEHISNAMYSFRVDRDFNSEADALAYLGGVNDLESFREAVND
ncbi:hypothetical protein [Butyrivibrio sp. AC2005]|uniref:hypothetical protein n=1 Tax=Butyrivibrio sp. AC2005 TaxID=1280672 RepID=UPI00041B0235|nr:hypothetical protein [Butyrivibrio sp. AC2005]